MARRDRRCGPLLRGGPKRLRGGFVEEVFLAVRPQNELESSNRRRGEAPRKCPARISLIVHHDDCEGFGAHGRVAFEDSNFRPLYVVRIVVVHPEVDGASEASSVAEARRRRGDTQSPSVFEVIEAEGDVSLVECNIGASLNIRGTAAGIVNRFTIYRDSHQVEGERILGRELAGNRRDI